MYKYTYFNQKGDTQKPKNMIEKRSESIARLRRLSGRRVRFALAFDFVPKVSVQGPWASCHGINTENALDGSGFVMRTCRHQGITSRPSRPGKMTGALRGKQRGGRDNSIR